MFIELSTVESLKLRLCTPTWDIVLLERSHDSELITVCDHILLICPLNLFIRYFDHLAISV